MNYIQKMGMICQKKNKNNSKGRRKILKKIIDIKINNVVNKYKRVLINKENKPLERKKYILKILKESEIEIEKGEGIKSDIAFEELRHKFGY